MVVSKRVLKEDKENIVVSSQAWLVMKNKSATAKVEELSFGEIVEPFYDCSSYTMCMTNQPPVNNTTDEANLGQMQLRLLYSLN